MRDWTQLFGHVVSIETEDAEHLEDAREFLRREKGKRVVAFDPAEEVLLVLDAEAALHLLELLHGRDCAFCRAVRAQVEAGTGQARRPR